MTTLTGAELSPTSSDVVPAATCAVAEPAVALSPVPLPYQVPAAMTAHRSTTMPAMSMTRRLRSLRACSALIVAARSVRASSRACFDIVHPSRFLGLAGSFRADRREEGGVHPDRGARAAGEEEGGGPEARGTGGPPPGPAG